MRFMIDFYYEIVFIFIFFVFVGFKIKDGKIGENCYFLWLVCLWYIFV